MARHGQTVWNVEGRWQGSRDIPLDGEGLAQAERLAEKLLMYSARNKIEAAYTSPLARAAATADACAAKLGLRARRHDGLVEMRLGAWEGLSFPEIAARYPEEFSRFNADPRAAVGMGVESHGELQERATGAFWEICGAEKRDTLIVTHGGWLGALLRELLGVPFGRRHGFAIGNVGLSIVECDFSGERSAKVATLNDCSHLGGL